MVRGLEDPSSYEESLEGLRVILAVRPQFFHGLVAKLLRGSDGEWFTTENCCGYMPAAAVCKRKSVIYVGITIYITIIADILSDRLTRAPL